eukprot:TRINITY_DN2831_c0_g1_i1.p1 TRINITY_DN2831_c0_g1~~TRINITY_DN2831_c0_g1_i1.p1  ORF type:complete len:415 (+),score=148.13 TRINITY_DN2831_c0_g1_i1:78-1322(+)
MPAVDACRPLLMLLVTLCHSAMFAQAAVQNDTWYRVTPLNYSGMLANFNTGDIPGDCYFGIYELTFPFWCDVNPGINGCANQPILSIPGYNVYESHVVEHDTRLGAYSSCNPNRDTGVFACSTGLAVPSITGTLCWYDVPEWVDSFGSLCNRSACSCAAVAEQAVGAEQASTGNTVRMTPLDGDPRCFTLGVLNSTAVAAPYDEHTGVSDGACCGLLSEVSKSPSFTGFAFGSYNTATRTCRIGKTAKVVEATPDDTTFVATSGGLNGSGHYYMETSMMLADRLDGTWYSTRAEGECQPGQAVGDGCWWRDHGVGRRINATCLSNNLVLALYAGHPACWDEQCAGGVESPLVGGVLQPLFNITSECSVRCLLETALGLNGSHTVGPGLDSDSICKGFYTSFHHSDPALFGCPDV